MWQSSWRHQRHVRSTGRPLRFYGGPYREVWVLSCEHASLEIKNITTHISELRTHNSELATIMISVDLLIFDLDGTLADTKDDIATAVNLTLREFNLPPKEPAAIYSYVGDGVRKLLQRAFEDQSQGLYDQALKVFRKHYLAHLLD